MVRADLYVFWPVLVMCGLSEPRFWPKEWWWSVAIIKMLRAINSLGLFVQLHGFCSFGVTILKTIFRVILDSQQNWGRYRDFPYTCLASPIINNLHHLLQLMSLLWLAHYNHPKCIVYLLVFYTLCVWTNVQWLVSTIIVYLRHYSTLKKSSVISLFISLKLPTLGNNRFFFFFGIISTV